MNSSVKIVKQLKDNYSYIIYSNESKKAIVIDPSEPKPILDFLKDTNLNPVCILITHHHSDHTQGIDGIIKDYERSVYTPNNNIKGTTDIIIDKQILDFEFINFEVIATPGHTLDHVVFYSEKEKILFSGDTLFYYGCGRIFEGTYEQMLNSLNKLKNLPNDIKVFCGHEYTTKNIEFVLNEIMHKEGGEIEKRKIIEIIEKNGSSMPFDLGHQKDWNPFINCNDTQYKRSIVDFYKNKGLINKDSSELEFFTYIREKRNKF